MWSKIQAWFGGLVKSFNDFLQANPKVKNWLDGLEKVVIASVLSYFAVVVNDITNGVPLTVNMSHGLLVGLAGGLWIAVSGAIKAYSQNLHDIILANTQDATQAIQPTGNAPVTSSVLTPVAAPLPSTLTPTPAPKAPNLPPRN
jgi:hypothetical protein